MRWILAWGGLAATVAAQVAHGPLVVWDGQAATEARIVWLENSGPQEGQEGQWFRGNAGFGFADGDDATVFPKMRGKYDSLAIRRKVSLPADLPPDAVLILDVDYDDGFVAWWDGREVARRNVVEKGGKPQAEKKHNAGRWEMIRLGTVKDLVKPGSAVLAIQGFNDGSNSSDFSLHPRLLAVAGDKRVELIPKGAEWECLAGGVPDPPWQTTTSLKESQVSRDSRALPCVNVFPQSKPDEGQLVYGEARAFGDTRIRVSVVRLSGLKGNTIYGFTADAGQGAAKTTSQKFSFRTAPEVFAPFTFVTGGDMYHRRQLLDPMNRRAGLEDPLFAMLGGDLAYCNGVDSKRWLDWVDSWVTNARAPDGRLIPMVTAIGNHEVRGIGYSPVKPPGIRDAPYYRSLFLDDDETAPHCVDFGNYMSLVLLDSGHAAPVRPQAEFLAKSLDARASVPRVFACYHRPAYGSGTKEDAKEIQQAWCPLFERYLLDAVFENDHHTFKRSLPIRAGNVDEKDGVPYVGDGAWGVDVRKVDQKEVKKRPWLAKADAVNHLHRVEVGAQGYKVTTKKADGTVIDGFERAWRRGK